VKRPKVFGVLTALAVILAPVPSDAQAFSQSDREGERTTVESLQAEMAPEICSLAGFERCEPVPVLVWTREELRTWMRESLKEAFPENEWSRLGQCLALLGLVPEHVDLQEELLDLLVRQAGAGYSPELGSYVSLLDVPDVMRSPLYRRMVVAHEVTHAFQDRSVDMVAMHLADLTSLDRSFAHRAAFEGMASVVMYSVARGLPLTQLPDVAEFMRERFTGSGSAPSDRGSPSAPALLTQYLFEPYPLGSAFVQRVLEARPRMRLVSLLAHLPQSEEQVLHPEKYLSGDLPTPIDLDRITNLLPDEWQVFHRNEIGEQDLRLLFASQGIPPEVAHGAASGWDGSAFVGITDGEGSRAVVGSSVWDSPEDAEEFSTLFRQVLLGIHDTGMVEVEARGNRVSFVVGSHEAVLATRAVLAALSPRLPPAPPPGKRPSPVPRPR
jgi:hypothetical protein